MSTSLGECKSCARTRKLLNIVIVFCLLVVGLLYFIPPGSNISSSRENLPLAEPPAGGDFVVQSADGMLDLASLRGQTVLLYFGYTSCPDICPTALSIIAMVLNELTPAELAKTQVVFISVDPERDTPKKLMEYTAYFHPKIIGATTKMGALDEIVKRYGAAYRKVTSDSPVGDHVDHSASTYIVAPDGKLYTTLPHGTKAATILDKIRELNKKTD